jgi:hypothetical protein
MGESLDQLAALQQRLRCYVDGWRRLPGELASLADGLQQSADRLAAISRVAEEPPTKGEAA